VFVQCAFESQLSSARAHSSISEQFINPENSGLQVQLNEPKLFVQYASGMQEFESKHSLMSKQFTPSPINPGKHWQECPPNVLVQTPYSEHGETGKIHSFRSGHDTPSPINPTLHAQLNPPIVLLQVA